MPVSSETMDAIRKVCLTSVLCPLCGKFDENSRYESLMSCGHHLCHNCVQRFVLNTNNKCPKCYAIHHKSDLKDDQYLNELRKMTKRLGALVTKRVKRNDSDVQHIQSEPKESKELPRNESKCVPKTQKKLIIESLKACISSTTKTMKSSDEESTQMESNSKKSGSRALAQTKAKIMVKLDDDFDQNKESIPDSFETNTDFSQNSHNLNKDNELMGKVSEIITDLHSNSSNESNKMNSRKPETHAKQATDLVINKMTNESATNVGFEQKKNETKIPKRTQLSNTKQKLNVANKSSAVGKVDDFNEKKKEKQEIYNKSVQVDISVRKPSEEKSFQVNIKEEKPKSISKGIQVMPKGRKSSERGVQCELKVTKCDVFTQTTAPEVITDTNQTNNSCHESDCISHKELSKIVELINGLPTLKALILNGLRTDANIDSINNSNNDQIVNSVQLNESDVKSERKPEEPLNQLESSVQINETIDESVQMASKRTSIKRQKRQSNKVDNKPMNTARRTERKAKAQPKKIKVEELSIQSIPSISSSSSSASLRSRTSSTERPKAKKICILISGLILSQKNKLLNGAKELNAEVVSDWNDKVTHLVVGTVDKKEKICLRNLKYLNSLLANLWIVTYEWFVDSMRSNRFVDETNYEIKCDKSATDFYAPNKSRTSGAKLFEGYGVCFKGDFKGLKCDLSELKLLVTIGGGKLCDSEKDCKRLPKVKKIIVVTETIGLPDTQDGVKYISVPTFLDTISNFATF